MLISVFVNIVNEYITWYYMVVYLIKTTKSLKKNYSIKVKHLVEQEKGRSYM